MAPVSVVVRVASICRSGICRSSSVVHGSSSICISCRLSRLVLLSWLQWLSLSLVAPVSVACGSSVSFVLVCGQLAQPVVVAPVAPVSVVVACPVAPVLSPVVACSWLQYLLFVAPAVAPVSSTIVCRSWLQYYWLCCFVLWLQSHGSSSICCRHSSWFQYLLSHPCVSSTICRPWLQYLLSFMAPVSPVVHGSGISCRSRLR